MINYFREQPRAQMLADALRGGMARDGGTQMAPRNSSFVSRPQIAQPNFDQYGGGSQTVGSDGVNRLAKRGAEMGWDAFKGSDTGKSMMSGISDLFGGFSNGSVAGGSGIRGGAPMAGGGTGGGFGNAMSSIFGGGGGAGSSTGGGMGGAMSAAGPIIGAVLGGLKVDDLLNESGKDKWYSAGKLNDLGTVNIGGKDMGFRVGDFANGIDPATWLSDPKKGATGLLNAFTFGLFD